MKVLLIAINKETSPYPVVPLGALCILNALEQAGHEVRFVDLGFATSDELALEQALADFAPQFVGVSIRNIDNTNQEHKKNYTPRTGKIIAHLRRLSSAPIVLGGSGYSIFPAQLLERLDADFGIAGPGEVALVALLQAYANNAGWESVPGLYYRRQGRLVQNAAAAEPAFFLPQVAKVDLSPYLAAGALMGIQTKRGCAFKCAYCTYPLINGSRFTLLDPKIVVQQLRRLQQDHQISDFFFVDDVFNSPYGHAAELCREIVRQGLQVRWYGFATPVDFDESLAKLMVEAGCQGVEFGTDAGHNTTLRGHGKDFNVTDIRQVGLACKRAKLPHCHYLIFGAPGETDETAEATLSLMEEIAPTMVLSFLGIRIYPHTKLAQLALEEGVLQPGQDLLQPAFYRAATFDVAALRARLQGLAATNLHWMSIDGAKVFARENFLPFVQQGYRGPFWDLMHRPTRMAFSPQKA